MLTVKIPIIKIRTKLLAEITKLLLQNKFKEGYTQNKLVVAVWNSKNKYSTQYLRIFWAIIFDQMFLLCVILLIFCDCFVSTDVGFTSVEVSLVNSFDIDTVLQRGLFLSLCL